MNQLTTIQDFEEISYLNEEHQVFLVQHKESKKIYVKKILHIFNPDTYLFLKEHPIPGIPGIVALSIEDSVCTVIENYIPGNTLEEEMQAHRLYPLQIQQILLQLCNIVERLHTCNPPLIHRDIKPSNIILTPEGFVYLLDFNAAKPFLGYYATDTVLLGTQGYAAPEQYGFGSSTPKTDIYAIGMTLQEMLLSSPSYDASFESIRKKCLQLDPANRYQQITDLRKDLTLVFSTKKKPPAKPVSFIPPGFRTGNPLKMLIAICGYALIFWMGLTIEVEGTTHYPILENIEISITILILVLATFDYCNIQRFLPLCKSKNICIKSFGVILLDTLLLFCCLFLSILVDSVSNSLF